ncbi:MAG: Gfo/Idh/MocA family oxidoreductase [Candidatus Dormibacteraeota bacterium]|nr:Gfo/Idh/MocA family oxidoreductase [Candidatus Dormibacteraeota bacterium]MBV9524891.1 Gfo/Idh/MocA family oxidoreductase [Candidatus Dormibacteraeota bacterium]
MSTAALPRIALVGAGAMGSNHARVIAESDVAELGLVIDIDSARAHALAERFGCPAATEVEAAGSCDAAVVATPTALHLPHARQLLDAGKPLLVEKPVAPALAETEELVAASEREGTPLMCGFVERFSPVVTTVLALLGETPVHIVTLRHSPQTPRSTLTVVLDLLIHDIDLSIRYAGGADVTRVSAATAPERRPVAEVADCILRFASDTVATLSASRASQRKVRSHMIETPEALYDVDLLRQDVTVYRHRSHEARLRDGLSYRAETVVDIPFVRHGGEPLALQLRHFVRLLDGAVDADAERASILPPHRIAAAVAGEV